MSAAAICAGIGVLLLSMGVLIALRAKRAATQHPIANQSPAPYSLSATIENFGVDREVRVSSQAPVVTRKLLGVVFSEADGTYFFTDVSAAANVLPDRPLLLKANGPFNWNRLESQVTTQFGRDGELLLDRFRLSDKSWVAVILEDANGGTFAVRTPFRLACPEQELHASRHEQPKIFAARDEDPVYYEQRLRPVARTPADRMSALIESWNSLRVAKKAAAPAKIGFAILGALLTGVLVVSFESWKSRLESEDGWRSISRFDQRVIAEFLRPLAGESLPIIAPSAAADPEAHRYAKLLQSVLLNAGWKAELREARGGPGTNFPRGIFVVTSDREHPALKPLKRALARASIDLPQPGEFWPYGVPELWPPGEELRYLDLGLLVGRSPSEPPRL